ncbi:MAG: class I SAM-dependent methyltransferase [Candidatus Zhuqueibacterota bacterium]
MKTRNPKSRFDITVKKSDWVLEVGGGHNPHPRSNVVVDKFYESNYHRGGNIKVLKKQHFCIADAEFLPFKDKAFDYIISNHVLEHVERPANFFSEFARVAPRGYIETPSLIGEYLIPKDSHKWAILELDGKITMVEKDKIGLKFPIDFGDLLLYNMGQKSLGFRILIKTYPDLLTVRHEWKDAIDYVIDPQDPALRSYFMGRWSRDQIDTMFRPKSIAKEVLSVFMASVEIGIEFMTSHLNGKK